VRSRARSVIIYAAAALLAAALIRHFHRLGGPYFTVPQTIQDHVAPVPFPSRDVILLARRAAEIIPRGATVTALLPSDAPNFDITHWMTAFGMMPRHQVVPPDLQSAHPPRYVLVVRQPFSEPRYRLISELPEGRIYELTK
jgi:hypothetical protein